MRFVGRFVEAGGGGGAGGPLGLPRLWWCSRAELSSTSTTIGVDTAQARAPRLGG